MLSALESLVLSLENNHSGQYNNKLFKHYDRVDFSGKSTAELRSQLAVQISLLKNSLIIFSEENPNVPWELPKNYGRNHADVFVRQAM